ncbi:MAG: 2,3-bisphosphoglycerate-independent phosphoglycerate mutase [Pseudomonadota bacterium]
MATPKPVVLCILDGWGLRAETEANAPALANTPTFDTLMKTCPTAELITHGPDVGLPTGQMGNSEVGHTNIGAGRVVAMDLGQIDLAIENNSFRDQPALQDFMATMRQTGGAVHLMGLASPGGVHSHQDHIIHAAEVLTEDGIPVAVHVFTDGRDVPPTSADKDLASLVEKLPEGAEIVTVTGRYYAMDRDNRWERVETAYRAIVDGEGEGGDSPVDVVEMNHEDDITDEFIPATVLGIYEGMQDDDGVFFINFRADRARQILQSIGDPEFDAFNISDRPELAAILGMVEYSDAHNEYMTAVFPKRELVNTLGDWVAQKGLKQFRLAETEKYPHVTFFLNGGVEKPYKNERRSMPNSPKVATYDLQPEMSAGEVADKLVEAIGKDFDLIVVNFANPDMVGHTGDLHAAMKACEAVDQGLGRAVEAVKKAKGAMIITADHGNCETMVDPKTGEPHTAHTTNPVPVILFGGKKGAALKNGRLADLAPTLLQLMDLDKPDEMTGESLIQ